ncbi:MAG: RCC1 repeat-containing protein, partial [Actinobacteria bacterium]|nr:RCC1 repeat-containing protein [Actinomycetota bacterium]
MAINSLPRASLPHRLSRPFSCALLIAACGVWIVESSHVKPASAVSAPLASVSSVSAGLGFTCAVSDGGVKCWGKNDAGQLGNGSTTSSTYPVQVTGLTSGVSSVAAGKDFACAVMLDATVRCWGLNASGQFGSGDTVSSTVPVDIGISDVSAIAAGTNSTCFIVSGAVQCAGANTNGQLGDGTLNANPSPIDTGLTGATSISVGDEFSCAVVSGGAKCWGRNNRRQIGSNTATNPIKSPTNVYGLTSGISSVTTGAQHGCASLSSGAMKCWGFNTNGQIGDGSVVQRATPVSVFASGVTAISARENSTCAVVSGAAQCWGANTWGQVGDGSTSARNVPTSVTSLTSGVTNIANGYEHACAVTSAAQVQCWGSQSDGAVGNAVPMFRDVPRAATGIASGATALSAGKEHTCAVVSGAAQCWGNNAFGQLGNNSTIPRSSAVQVQGLTSGVTAIAAGEAHSCAVVSGGAQCWGRNNFGQLGNSLNINSSVPVEVTGLGSGVVDISVGSNFSCALLSGGGVRCWGYGGAGQLGDGNGTSSNLPTTVSVG